MRVRVSFFFARRTSPARQDRCSTWPRVDADLVATMAGSGPVTAPVAIATARAQAQGGGGFPLVGEAMQLGELDDLTAELVGEVLEHAARCVDRTDLPGVPDQDQTRQHHNPETR